MLPALGPLPICDLERQQLRLLRRELGLDPLTHRSRRGKNLAFQDWAADTLTRVEAQLAGGYACYLALSYGKLLSAAR